MKKNHILALLLVLPFLVSSQTFLTENFDAGAMPPAGWTIDAHSTNWTAEGSVNAGGTAPEARFAWEPDFVGQSRIISPAIDLAGQSQVVLMFKHFLDDYDGLGGYSIGAATRSGGGAWNVVWTIDPMANVGPEEKIINISNSDVGSADFQFCIFFDGDSYNLDYWYIDDIMLFVPYEVDGAMAKITTPAYVSGQAQVEGVVRNLGISPITSMVIEWKVSDDMAYETIFTGLDIAFSESYSFVCDDPFYFPIGGYLLDVRITSVNGSPDLNPGNDFLAKAVSVVSHTVYRKPAFEEFTSSTCAPCAAFNEDFNPWTEDHAGDITLIKYQMNWPGAGDPYYTAEGGQRREYYGVSYVPWPQCNGSYVDYNVGAVEAAFQNAILQPGLAKIAATHTLNGTVMTVNANFLPFANFTNFRGHIIVIENTTTENTGNNGETEFHHVMMKMMPGANGTELNMDDRESATITEVFDLAGTNVEEFDDLSVVILFQDYTSKEIYQSAYSIENKAYATDSRVTGITYDGMPVPGFDPLVYDYEIELPAGTTEVPMVAAVSSDPNATAIVVPTWDLPGTTVVDCFGEDLLARSTYNIHFSVAVGIGETDKENRISLYPNPASNTLYLKGLTGQNIRIYNITGQLVMTVNNFADHSIDISSLGSGSYTLQAVTEDNTVIYGRFAVMR